MAPQRGGRMDVEEAHSRLLPSAYDAARLRNEASRSKEAWTREEKSSASRGESAMQFTPNLPCEPSAPSMCGTTPAWKLPPPRPKESACSRR